jgi:hypothetical protein
VNQSLLAVTRSPLNRRGDHFPARGMMLAAPEFVIAERVDLLDEV